MTELDRFFAYADDLCVISDNTNDIDAVTLDLQTFTQAGLAINFKKSHVIASKKFTDRYIIPALNKNRKPIMDAQSNLPMMTIPDSLQISGMQVVNYYRYLGIPLMQTSEDTIAAINWQTAQQAADLHIQFKRSKLDKDIQMAIYFLTLRARLSFKRLPLYAAGLLTPA